MNNNVDYCPILYAFESRPLFALYRIDFAKNHTQQGFCSHTRTVISAQPLSRSEFETARSLNRIAVHTIAPQKIRMCIPRDRLMTYMTG